MTGASLQWAHTSETVRLPRLGLTRSIAPRITPQSPTARASSRHGSRTGQARQISTASAPVVRSPDHHSGLRPTHAARSHHEPARASAGPISSVPLATSPRRTLPWMTPPCRTWIRWAVGPGSSRSRGGDERRGAAAITSVVGSRSPRRSEWCPRRPSTSSRISPLPVPSSPLNGFRIFAYRVCACCGRRIDLCLGRRAHRCGAGHRV